jgi:hypothetical protein
LIASEFHEFPQDRCGGCDRNEQYRKEAGIQSANQLFLFQVAQDFCGGIRDRKPAQEVKRNIDMREDVVEM